MKTLDVFLGRDTKSDNPYFCQISKIENGSKKILLSITAQSFNRLMEMIEVLTKENQTPDAEEYVFYNGKQINEEGKIIFTEKISKYNYEDFIQFEVSKKAS